MLEHSAVRRAAFAIWFIVVAGGAASADDYRIESYKNSVTRIIEIWSAKLADLGRQLTPINAEFARLQSPDDDARIAELTQKREDIRRQVDQATLELKVNLMLIEPPPKAPKRELIVLPDWLKEMIKAKGIPLGNGSAIVPDVDFDFKAMKLNSLVIGISFDW